MAQIVIDEGSWWSPYPLPNGKLMKAGVWETEDEDVITAALSAGLDWVRVLEGDRIINLPPATAAGVPVQLIDAHPADGGGETGPMTLRDLQAPNLMCDICAADGTRDKPFANSAALHSHRRAKHPQLDPASGLMRDGVAKMPDTPNVQQTVNETQAGVVTPENVETVPGPPAVPTPTPVEVR